MDKWSKEKRSEVMSHIRSKNTKPEMMVRSALHKLGYRYSLHRKELPGQPDLTLPKYNSVIFINGCFWHQHRKCRNGHIPKTRTEYWRNKFDKNVERDRRSYRELRKCGWNVIIVWECEIKNDLHSVIKNIIKKLN